ncbi:Protein of unknown function [Pyronema omphalodes CBS 100304]|uniref:Uncharacterized protein n=1 Tax=Pyronema omphalodes (strain CBS 100304) TaxID=1076935 RepID=U4LRK0_PYROM|nr:Protein of unknown function [Pyronema omphalodes CBS 100304]
MIRLHHFRSMLPPTRDPRTMVVSKAIQQRRNAVALCTSLSEWTSENTTLARGSIIFGGITLFGLTLFSIRPTPMTSNEVGNMASGIRNSTAQILTHPPNSV